MSKTKGDVVKDLREMLEDGQINLNEDDLYEASADRYKKYARAKKALNVPMPTAIVYPYTTGEVQKLLRYYNENRINVIPRSGNTATEGGLENWKELTIVIDAKNLNKIIIRDNGQGFMFGRENKIFERYFLGDRTKEGSSGLGLSIAQQVIKQHFGTITASNRECGGAEFLILFPQMDATTIY